VFTSSKRALPFLTVAMLAISAFVRSGAGPWRCWLPAAARPGPGAPQRGLSRAHDAALLRLPLLGRLARGYNAARFGGTLAMLAGAGVPILKALQAAAETLGNRAMRADALDALVQVREGAPLASALAARSASRACWRCSPGWVNRPASCR
jgi:general secretion pathway protein F